MQAREGPVQADRYKFACTTCSFPCSYHPVPLSRITPLLNHLLAFPSIDIFKVGKPFYTLLMTTIHLHCIEQCDVQVLALFGLAVTAMATSPDLSGGSGDLDGSELSGGSGD